MTEFFIDPTDEEDGVSDEVRWHSILADVNWEARAAMHADAWHETGDPEEFSLLIGAAALAAQKSEARRQILALNRQLRLE